jgi:hypothetical protein
MRYPTGTALQVITPTTGASTYLKLDQTTHQHVINDYPRFDAGLGLVGNYGLYWRDIADANTVAYLSYDGNLTLRAVTGDLTLTAGGSDIGLTGNTDITGTLSTTATATFPTVNVTNSAGTTLTDTAVVNIRQNDAFDAVWTVNTTTWTDNTTSAKTTGGSFSVLSTSRVTYFGYLSTFGGIYVDINTSGVGCTTKVEYWNGASWTNYTASVTDGTTNFTVDGSLTFAIPGDWAAATPTAASFPGSPPDDVSRYWMRISSTTASSTTASALIAVPSSKSPFQVFAQSGDATPAIYISPRGPYVGIGTKSELSIGGSSLFVVGAAFFTANVTSGGPIGVQRYGITTTSTDGFYTYNDKSATGSTTVERSPRLRFRGEAWDGAASKSENWINEVTPIAGASPTTSYLAWSHASNDSSTYTEDMRLTSGGNLFLGTTDTDGTPPIGRLVVKASTNDGSTNIFVGRDSAKANVFTVDTNGGFTANGNSTIGSGEAGVDYTLTFNGETNDGVITWQEDEDTFAMACNMQLTDAGSKLGVGVAPSYPIHAQVRAQTAYCNYTDSQFSLSWTAPTIGVGSYLKNTGNESPVLGSHGMAVWGHYEDVADSQLMGIGTEGKVTAYGTGSIYGALVGYARFFNAGGTGPTGRIEGLHIKTEIAKSEGGTAIATGVGTGVYVEPIIGGAAATKYAFLGHDKIQVSASEGSTDTVYMSRTSSSADIVVEGNDNLTITVPSAQHILIHDNAGTMAPSSSAGVDLGASSYEWGALHQKGALVLAPSATQTIDAAGDTILANAGTVILDPGTSSDFTLTSAPTIADGYPGQRLTIIIATTSNKTVTIQDQDTLANSNIQLPWNNLSIGVRDVVTLVFNGADWCLAERQDN